MKTRLGIVIPTYNERENISKLVPKIFSVCKKNKIDVKVLIVDDNSPDKTFDLVRQLSKKYKISGIKRSRKLGLGTAYVKGFQEMLRENVDAVMEMDSDLSHDPIFIPDFVRAVDKGKDVVVGSRKINRGKIIGWSIRRKLVSSVGNMLARLFTGIMLTDMTSGYRIYSRKVLESIDLNKIESKGFAMQIEMLYKANRKGFKISETPIVFVDRKVGKSKLSLFEEREFFKIGLKILFRIL